ncbi:hypothetical protein EMIHUDRAFT_259409 [Emiliania huxleyi CCMP1516]|uniref:Uncharacterized protein n=2 Tax=Emiliania huxleyi TaxID=2903 RepID=A0A0D3I0Y5_EMIH1|nr:hypothetical protein EMIHUDRAFT_259409 [Emiliania huxleyi CCMP1516]EOD04920.1 hypothetical protein EMIHUDRAFT_259409 [Emiliania huxleyi CCMP1516]|eukprot:XP_005757349.1 hypothetical protein EMIHUDRAFT_259409 [Emiliania huxleyi CCMP1516]
MGLFLSSWLVALLCVAGADALGSVSGLGSGAGSPEAKSAGSGREDETVAGPRPKKAEEACGVLTVSNKIAPAAPKRRARGGKASRARRLENFWQHKAAAPAAAPAIKWEQLAHRPGLLRQQRATLRDGARAAWVRMRAAARAKIGAAVRGGLL